MRLLITILCIQCAASLTAQKLRCGVLHHETIVTSEPKAVFRNDIQNIQTVIHIVYNTPEENLSDERIQSQIDQTNLDLASLNEDISLVPDLFTDLIGTSNIQLVLAQKDPFGEETTGINRTETSVLDIGCEISLDGKEAIKYTSLGGEDAWNPELYLNIWVGKVDSCNFFGITAPLSKAGTSDDGIIITPEAFGLFESDSLHTNMGRTLTHEIGHYLGLNHLWGSDRGCSNDDDGISDTPEQEGPYFECPEFPQVSCGSADMHMNFMEFVDDDCLLFFTKEQVDIMDQTLNDQRSGIIVSTAETAHLSPDIPFDIGQDFSTLNIESREIIEQDILISVYSMSGQVLHKELLNQLDRYSIHTNAWPKSVYILSIHTTDRRFTHTFIGGL